MSLRARSAALAHAVLAVMLVCLALPAAAQIFGRLPAGWTEDIEETYWIATSNRDGAGYVSLIRPAAMPVGGTRESAFAELAEQWASSVGGTITGRGPATELLPRYSTLSRVFQIRDAQGRTLSLQVVAHFWRSQPQSYADVFLLLAPEPLARSDRDKRWQTGIRQIQSLVAMSRDPLYPSELQRLHRRDQELSGQLPQPPPAPAPQPPAPTAQAEREAVPSWTARFDGTGVTLVPPCGAGGAGIRAGVFRAATDFGSFPGVIGGEVEALIQVWTGGGQAKGYGTLQVQGNIATMAASFVAGGRLHVGWFAVAKRGQLTQRGYVVWPETDKQDPRLPGIIQAVRDVLASGGQPQLELAGTAPPAAPSSRELEAVLHVPGGVFADDRQAVDPATVEIALWRNGAVTQSRGGARGRWHRLAGGAYAVAIEGGLYDSSVMHLSGTCRVAAKTTMPPPPPPPPLSPGSGSCRRHDIQTAHYASMECTMIGGQRSCRTVLKPVHTTFSFCD